MTCSMNFRSAGPSGLMLPQQDFSCTHRSLLLTQIGIAAARRNFPEAAIPDQAKNRRYRPGIRCAVNELVRRGTLLPCDFN